MIRQNSKEGFSFLGSFEGFLVMAGGGLAQQVAEKLADLIQVRTDCDLMTWYDDPGSLHTTSKVS